MRRRVLASLGKALPFLRRAAWLHSDGNQFVALPGVGRSLDEAYDMTLRINNWYISPQGWLYIMAAGNYELNKSCMTINLGNRTGTPRRGGVVLPEQEWGIVLNTIFDVRHDNVGMRIGSMSVSWPTTPSGNITSTVDFTLFRSGESSTIGKLDIFAFSVTSISTGNVLKKITPVIVANPLAPNGEEGALYDEVSGAIFRNSGTGWFTWGELET